MTWQAFGTLAGGNQNASLFDTLTGQIANCVVIPCTCGGSANAIALTALGGTATPPNIASYINYQCFSFVAASGSTGNVNLQAFGLASLPLYSAGGSSQVGSGGIVAAQPYIVMYVSALNGGNGGFVIISASASTLSIPVTVAQGGTGVTSTTAYCVICGGTTGTNPLQPVAGVGTAGQVLTSNGPGALPTMQSISATSFVLLSTLTASGSATLQDTTHITSTYTLYAIAFENILPATNGVQFKMLITENGGSSYPTTNYVSVVGGVPGAGGTGGTAAVDSATSGFLLTGIGTAYIQLANTANYGLNGLIYFANPNSSTRKFMYGYTSYYAGAGVTNLVNPTVAGYYDGDNNVINGLQFLMSSGNITSGKIRIYGVSL